MTKEKIQDAVYTHRFVYNFHYHLILVTKYRHQTFATKKLWSPVNKIDNLNRDFFVLCHD